MAKPWEEYQDSATTPPRTGPWTEYAEKPKAAPAAKAGPWTEYAPAQPAAGSAPGVTSWEQDPRLSAAPSVQGYVPPATPLKPTSEAQWQANERQFESETADMELRNRHSNLQAIGEELLITKDPGRREILLKEYNRIAKGEETKGPAVPAFYRRPTAQTLPGRSRVLDAVEGIVKPIARSSEVARTIGAGENALAFGTGMAAAPVAGLAGLAALPIPGVQAGDVVRRVQDYLTYAPRSQAGQRQAENLGGVMAYPSRLAEQRGESWADKGYPLLGTAARVGLDPMAWLAIAGGLPKGGPPIRPTTAPQVPWQGQGLPPPPGARPSAAPTLPPLPPTPGRIEPTLGTLPQPPSPEFAPLARDISPLDRRSEPSVGGLPQPPKTEFPDIDLAQNVGGVEFIRIPPDTPPGKPRIKGPAATIRDVPEGTIQVGDQPVSTLPQPPVTEPAPQVPQLPTSEIAIKPVAAAPGHTNRLDFSGETVARGPELPRPPYEPPVPKGELDLRPRYRLTGPDDEIAGVHVVQDTSRRVGGTEEGKAYQHKQTAAFRTKVEQFLFETAAAEGKTTGDMWFNRLQDRVRNLEPEESGYAYLADMTIPELKRAAKRYRDQVRTQLEAAARDNEGEQINVLAEPYDRSVYEGPEAPPAPTEPTGGLPTPPGGAAALAPEGAPLPKPPENATTRAAALYEEQLRMLDQRLEKGLITEEQFQTQAAEYGRQRDAKVQKISEPKIGDRVSAGGRDGVILTKQFGTMRVKFDDGKVQSFTPQEVQPVGTRTFAKAGTEGRGALNVDVDSLSTAVSKLGGLSRDQMLDVAGDTKGSYKTKSGLSVFRKDGADVDTMLQRLYENGYISEENWRLDNGKSFLEEALRDEIGGGNKHYSLRGNEEARFARMRDERAYDDGGGPGTLSANPMFNPRAVAATGQWVGGLMEWGARMMTSLSDAGQRGAASGGRAQGISWAFDNLVDGARQTAMQDMAAVVRHEAGRGSAKRMAKDAVTIEAIKNEYAAVQALAAKKLSKRWGQQMLDLGQPAQTLTEMVEKTEMLRRMLAREEYQRKMVATGEAINTRGLAPSDKAKKADYREMPMWANKLPDGRYLHIAKDAYPVVEQFLQARDTMAFTDQGPVLRAWDQFAQASINATMMLPTFHMWTVGSRMLPFEASRNPWWTKPRHDRVIAMMGDRATMQGMYADGLKQFPVKQTDRPTGSEMGPVEKQMTKSAQTQAVYNAYTYTHNIMSHSVNYGQLLFYDMAKTKYIEKGMDPEAAHLMAIRMSNTMAGNLAKAEMGSGLYKVLGGLFFSRGYTTTVLAQLMRAISHDRTLQAALRERGYTPEQAIELVKENRKHFQNALVRDYITHQAQMQIGNYIATYLADEPDKDGKKGGHFTWQNKGADPVKDMIAPTYMFVGRGEDGKGVYMRAAFRTTLDMLLFWQQVPQALTGARPEWFSHKIHPFPRFGLQAWSGEHAGGQPIGDKPATFASIVEAMVPPLADEAHAAAEAWRQNNLGYLTDFITGEMAEAAKHPGVTIGNLAGAQLRVVDKNWEKRRGSTEVFQARDIVQKRAGQIRKGWEHLQPEQKKKARKSIREEARKQEIRPPILGPPRPPSQGTQRAIKRNREEE